MTLLDCALPPLAASSAVPAVRPAPFPDSTDNFCATAAPAATTTDTMPEAHEALGGHEQPAPATTPKHSPMSDAAAELAPEAAPDAPAHEDDREPDGTPSHEPEPDALDAAAAEIAAEVDAARAERARTADPDRGRQDLPKADAAPPEEEDLPMGDLDDLAHVPQRKFLLGRLLEERGIGLLYGQSGCGKSTLSTHLALCLATGRPWFEMKARPCNVCMIALEGGQADLNLKVQAWRKLYPGFAIDPSRFRFIVDDIDLLGGGSMRLVNALRRRGNGLPWVAVIDTWHAAAGGLEENSADSVREALAVIKQIRTAPDVSVATLLVHHAGKADSGPRGSSSLPAAVDWHAAVSPGRLEITKARFMPRPFPVYAWKMRSVTDLGVTEDGEPESAGVVVEDGRIVESPFNEQETRALAVLADLVDRSRGEPVPEKEWRAAFVAGAEEGKQASARTASYGLRKRLSPRWIAENSAAELSLTQEARDILGRRA